MADTERAAREGQIVQNWHRLSAVYGTHAPKAIDRIDGGDKLAFVKDWRPFAFACLARCHYTLQSMVSLHLRAMDAACLGRVLCEHVTTFAWLMINPPINHRQLLRSELREREKMLADSAKHVRPPSDPAALEEMRAIITAAAADKAAPELPDRASIADQHWGATIPNCTFYFRKNYSNIWRGFSVHVHPTWMGLVSFVNTDRKLIRFGLPAEPLPDFVLSLGVTLFADALRVCSFSQGWPPLEEIAKAFLHDMPFSEAEKAELARDVR